MRYIRARPITFENKDVMTKQIVTTSSFSIVVSFGLIYFILKYIYIRNSHTNHCKNVLTIHCVTPFNNENLNDLISAT